MDAICTEILAVYLLVSMMGLVTFDWIFAGALFVGSIIFY